MKVVSPAEMMKIESLAYKAGASSEDFMEQAGRSMAVRIEQFIREHRHPKIVTLLCGKGNNAGDAYTAGRYLLRQGYAVSSYQIGSVDLCTTLCLKNYQRFIEDGGTVTNVSSAADFVFPPQGIIVDGLLGVGFNGAAEGLFAAAIAAANGSGLPILAVDVPSGLNGSTGEVQSVAIQAAETLFCGLPKLGFFLQEGWNCVGKLVPIDFGLDEQLIGTTTEEMTMLTGELMKALLPHIRRNRNKYDAGKVVGWAGSPGMPGAALLASKAVLRAGAGLVHLLYPEQMHSELTSSPYELIKEAFNSADESKVVAKLNTADACFIGPGIGRNPATLSLLKKVLTSLQKPCVIDADALTLGAEEQLAFPKGAVITPHMGEMRRLLRTESRDPLTYEWLNRCQKFAEEKQLTVVLKGAPTFVLSPKEPILVSTRGDPGMATAGCGDVLTGIIAALLAQRMQARDAAALGVYLHGTAGEEAAKQFTSYGLIASDVIQALPQAFIVLAADKY